jgi:hypothetical protein
VLVGGNQTEDLGLDVDLYFSSWLKFLTLNFVPVTKLCIRTEQTHVLLVQWSAPTLLVRH